MFLLIDKPKGITSHDVIDRVRKITGERRVGHSGTLDPNATGLLIIGIGRESTKKLSQFLKLDKEYEAEIFLGEERETDDIEGEIRNMSQKQVRVSYNTKSVRDDITGLKSLPTMSKFKVEKILKTFIGEQMQIPPLYSAIKIRGKKAYQLARKGLSPVLSPRKINIYKIELLEYKYPILKIKAKVSSGTYIRSLARDLGRKLGCGAYLSNLRRVKIGNFKVEDSVELDLLNKNNLEDYYNHV